MRKTTRTKRGGKTGPVRRQFANAGSGLTGTKPSSSAGDYPAKPKDNAPLRTKGEPSISTERVQMSVRMRFNPLRGLTPERLVKYLDDFWLGFFRQPAVLWDKMEQRDPTLKTVIPKRKKAVARHGWEVITVEHIPDGMEDEAQQQKEDLTYFYNNLTATDAMKPDMTGGMALLARQMMDAQCKYYAVHETVWQPGPDGLTAQFVFCPLWWFEGTTGKLRYLDSEFQIYGRDMLPGEWLVTCGEGLMEAASVCKMYQSLSLTDWLDYSERFGKPFVDAATSAEPGSAEWEALKTYANTIGSDGAGVRSQGSTIDLKMPTGTSGAETFSKMVEHMERLLTILFRGGDLGTTGGKDKTGASLQGGESDILEDDDCTLIEETLGTQVSRFVIKWSRGPEVPVLAYLKFRRSEKDSTDGDLKVDQFLLGQQFPMTVGSMAERYDRPLPEGVDGSELLRGPMPPAVDPNNPNDPNDPNPRPGKPKQDEDPELANEATFDLAQAIHETILPILKRLEAIAALDDATMQQHMLEKLLSDFPQIAEVIRHDNSLAKKLSPKLETSLLAGMKRIRPEIANGDEPGHPFRGNQHVEAMGQITDVARGRSQEALWDVHPDIAAKIQAATGRDVKGFKHMVDRDGLVHIFRQHGEGNETDKDQIAIGGEDLLKIPDIVRSPDTVEKGETTRRGLPSVKYSKKYPDGTTFYVEEHWQANRVLMAKTLYKRKAGK